MPLTELHELERRHSLELEKQLVSIHGILKRRYEEESRLGHEECADALQVCLWHLGTAVLQAVRLRGD
jgi:hypothetical protein